MFPTCSIAIPITRFGERLYDTGSGSYYYGVHCISLALAGFITVFQGVSRVVMLGYEDFSLLA
jgi:hypothetical protein